MTYPSSKPPVHSGGPNLVNESAAPIDDRIPQIIRRTDEAWKDQLRGKIQADHAELTNLLDRMKTDLKAEKSVLDAREVG